MKLFKFRSLRNIKYALDIILNERLHCALYSELNDPVEGLFYEVEYHLPITNLTPRPWPVKETRLSKVDNLKVCSMSSGFEDVRLWSHYADGYRGIAIEIDFNDSETLYAVDYDDKLIESGKTILTKCRPEEVLSKKTTHWEYEKEWRLIQKEEYYSIKDKIRALYVGTRIDSLHLEVLKKIVPSGIPIYSTAINHNTVTIQRKKKIER